MLLVWGHILRTTAWNHLFSVHGFNYQPHWWFTPVGIPTHHLRLGYPLFTIWSQYPPGLGNLMCPNHSEWNLPCSSLSTPAGLLLRPYYYLRKRHLSPDLASTCHKRPGLTAFQILWFTRCPLCPLSLPMPGPSQDSSSPGTPMYPLLPGFPPLVTPQHP